MGEGRDDTVRNGHGPTSECGLLSMSLHGHRFRYLGPIAILLSCCPPHVRLMTGKKTWEKFFRPRYGVEELLARVLQDKQGVACSPKML